VLAGDRSNAMQVKDLMTRAVEERVPPPDSQRAPARLETPDSVTSTPERAIVAGFIASAAMLLAFAVAYAAARIAAAGLLAGRPGGASFIDVLGQWFYGLTDNALIDATRPNGGIALAVYFVGGLAWAVLYAYVGRPLLSGPEWRRGLVFAIVPWLFSLLVFLPLIGGGPLGLSLGAGPLPIVGNLILHAVYGLTLAAVYGPLWSVIPDFDSSVPTLADVRANHGAQVGIAAGLLIGLLAGAAIGLALSRTSAIELDTTAAMLAGALFAGTAGALTGSFLGLSEIRPRA
jgi:hypothetical protein